MTFLVFFEPYVRNFIRDSLERDKFIYMIVSVVNVSYCRWVEADLGDVKC